MNVFIYHTDQWHLAGALQQSNNGSGYRFSYELEYAKTYVNDDSNFALNSMLPVRLMEVFKPEKIKYWLDQFLPLELTKVNPQFCLGNVALSNTQCMDLELAQSTGMSIEQFLRSANQHNSDNFAWLDLGYANSQPYWFVATDGRSFFPLRAIEINTKLVPVMLPLPTEKRFGVANHSDFTAIERRYYTELLNRLNTNCLAALGHWSNAASNIPDSLFNIALPRPDIINTESGYNYLSIEKFHNVFNPIFRDSDDLIELILTAVSTYKRKVNKFGSTQIFVLELLKRDLLLRLFNSPYSIADIDVIKSERGYAFSLMGMELFAAYSGHTKVFQKTLNWPYPIHINQQMDVPLLCDALSEVTEPRMLLVQLNEFSERLVNLLSLTQYNLPETKNTRQIMERMARFNQQLARWGLLI